ncbi:hypothetical protein N431DRAFT_404684 [Stipitochalara longipes BDJ]|nr:hypothetical protein N431DRAFT_404684 [Stipitochalara longipes BDJ]
MKYILTGTSGFIGSEILAQCLSNQLITSLLIFSRRPLPDIESRDPRIKIVVLDNFLSYPESVKSELTGVKAVLWTLGGSNSRPTPKGKCDEVEVQYPLALATALIEASKKPAEHVCHVVKIRFLFISGTFSVRDQNKSLWMLEEGRKARGLAETKLLELAEKNADFEAAVIKCGYVLRNESAVPEVLVEVSRNAIRVDELAAAMIEIAVMGSGSKTFGNSELRSMGKRLLKERREKYK